MFYEKQGNQNKGAGNIKWRRQCLCLRRSWLEVCCRINRLSAWFCR
ncbi:MAG: hypothetical protein PUC73_12020 [Lachnospiraceae bacterium]|nr:hypothetical protein [Lachnospiraceae bacterium]